MVKVVQFRAEAGSKLRQHNTDTAGEKGFAFVDVKSGAAENPVVGEALNRFTDNVSMNVFDDSVDGARSDDTVD